MKTTTNTDAKPGGTTTVVDDEGQDLPPEPRQDAIALLQSWLDADEAEVQDQIETWEALRKALGEDRNSYRKLFP